MVYKVGRVWGRMVSTMGVVSKNCESFESVGFICSSLRAPTDAYASGSVAVVR